METIPPPPLPPAAPPDAEPARSSTHDEPSTLDVAGHNPLGAARLSRRTRAIGLVAMVGVIVAIASAAGGLGHGRQGAPKAPELLLRVGVGLGIGGALGLALLALLHALDLKHAATRRFLYNNGDRKFSTALRRALPAIALLAALGALIGAALTPLYPRSNTPPPPKQGQGDAKGRYTDRNGDGVPELEIDANGDGTYEGYFVPCEGTKLPGGPLREGDGAAEGKIRVAVDRECDGKIDYYTEIRLDQFGNPEATPGRTVDKNGKVSRTNKNGAPKTKPKTTKAPSQQTGTTKPNDPNKRPDSLNFPKWIGWLLLGLIGAAIVGALVWGYLKRSKKPDKPEPDDETIDAEIMAESVAASVDLAENDPDPRKAIIAAYARLLDGLAAAGLPRRPEEAPEEHLARSLSSLPIAPGPFRELTRLFALARFSQHPITEAHRGEALTALGAVQVELTHLREPVGAS
jgi:Domain of unknown function (DUF4129)